MPRYSKTDREKFDQIWDNAVKTNPDYVNALCTRVCKNMEPDCFDLNQAMKKIEDLWYNNHL